MLAFTLSRRDYREYDQFVSFYTKEHGKVETVARGIKKSIAKNAPTLEPFSLIDIEVVPGKNASYVTKAVTKESFLAMREDPQKIIFGNFVLELVERSVGVGAGESTIFRLLYSALQFLNDSKEVSQLFLPAFLFRLCTFLGFTPVLSGCSSCGKKKVRSAAFDPGGGGLICDDCASKKNESIRLNASDVQTLRSLLKNTWDKLPNADKNEGTITSLVQRYAEYHLAFKIADMFRLSKFSRSGFANFSQKDYNFGTK